MKTSVILSFMLVAALVITGCTKNKNDAEILNTITDTQQSDDTQESSSTQATVDVTEDITDLTLDVSVNDPDIGTLDDIDISEDMPQ